MRTFELLHQFSSDGINQAMVFAFIHGLIQLTNAGHTEVEKGLSDSQNLITNFVKKWLSSFSTASVPISVILKKLRAHLLKN